MDTDIRPADRAVLHVIPDPAVPTQPMQEALLRTGRTVLTREDLYQAMGALAGSKRSTPIDAVFISAAAVAHDDAEFFEIVPRSFPNVTLYVYGESSHQADSILQKSTAAPIDPESVDSLFHAPIRKSPSAEVSLETPATEFEMPTEREQVAPAPGTPPELEQRLLRSLDEEEASSHAPSAERPHELPDKENDSKDYDVPCVADVDLDAISQTDEFSSDADDHEERPPVPWNPSLARPARTPPRQDGVLEVVEDTEEHDGNDDDYVRRSDEEDSDQPLLTREELDALLQEEHDSTDGVERRI